MQIKTYGRTADQMTVTATRDEIVSTMKEIEAVRRAKGEVFFCPYFYAKEITLRVKAGSVEQRLANKAARIADRIGRRRRVSLA